MMPGYTLQDDQKSRISSKYLANPIGKFLAPTEYVMNQNDDDEEEE